MTEHGDVTNGVASATREIGLISDTHGLVRASVFDALAGVELILHAGDVGTGVLAELSAIAPVRAVYGNTDEPGLPDLEAELVYEIDGVSIHVSHGHELGRPTPAALLAAYPQDVLVYGHTHRQLITRADGRLIVNPGAAGPRRFDLMPSVARLTVARGGESGDSTGSAVHGGAGFYFQLAPDDCWCGGGLWMPPREARSHVRDRLAARGDEWQAIVGAPAFRRRFGAVNAEARLTRVPRGYAAEHPAADWLRYQSFTAGRQLSEEHALAPKLADRLVKDFAVLLPMVRWLNDALGFRPAERR